MDFDLKIFGSTIIYSSGFEGYRGDEGIFGRRIAALGEMKGDAARTLDAGGLMICPGFVDIHTHYDAKVMWDRMLTTSPSHGVTTAVVVNGRVIREDNTDAVALDGDLPGRVPRGSQRDLGV